ncbi:exonuclease domain-containing protein [Streptosporangium sp. NPDC006930]|uniref:exonuclease domain-containing protein n=1 Tax=Streptosporangium sp. NPDC006930 TaxID=3154783 RepID=UPI0034468C45
MNDSWVAIDFETANSHRGSPCAVGMVSVEAGRIVDTFTTLIQPPTKNSWFAPFNVRLHGITESSVQGAPTWEETFQQILAFTDGRPLVAHNAAFDLGVFREACTASNIRWPDISYACSLVIARQTWVLASYGLPYVAEAAGSTISDHHDAGADARAAAEIMIAALRFHEAMTLHDLLASRKIRMGRLTANSWLGCHSANSNTRAPLPDANPNADPNGPFYGLTVCFTGTLLSMTRKEAHDQLADVGGQPAAGVSRKTDVLVIGTQDPARLRPGDDRSSKSKKAEELLAKGHGIEIISEVDFMERLACSEITK